MTRGLAPILLVVGYCAVRVPGRRLTLGRRIRARLTQPGPTARLHLPGCDAIAGLSFPVGGEQQSSRWESAPGFPTTAMHTRQPALVRTFGCFNVTPSIKIQQFRPKLSWNVSYAGGYQNYTYANQIGRSNANNNLFSQRAGAGFLWQLAPHWQLVGK